MTLNLIVIDDNPADILLFTESLDVVKDMLMQKDIQITFNVEVAINGIDGLEKLRVKEYDIIFMDVKMPQMNGIECLKELREDSLNKISYVVMFTTSDYDEDVINTYKLGASAYLLKSLDITEFEENLKNTIYLYIQDNFLYFNYVKNGYKKMVNN